MHTPPKAASPQAPDSAEDKALFSKVNWHLLPLLMACYVIAFIDRINIGFAQLQMKQTLSFSAEAYALGAGIFFIGYFLCEVPSNLMLEKIGARKTLLRIMFCWGVVASSLMFVETPLQFYVLRFLLGVFEAGFFPGVILYLTFWYPSARRGRVISVFMTAASIGYLLAGPMSGAIMKYMDGVGGHHGWQWLFVMQGLPASILGIVVFFVLKDKPEDAHWLTPQEKALLRQHLDSDARVAETASHGSFWAMVRDPKVLTMALIYFLTLGANFTMTFSSPLIIKGWGLSDLFVVGMLSTIPAIFGALSMVVVGRSSDKRLERRWHFMFCMVLGSLGVVLVMLTRDNAVLGMVALTLMAIGYSPNVPILFTAVSESLPKKSAAGGIALVSSLGNLGPAAMPAVVTWLNTHSGHPSAGFFLVIALWLVAGITLMLVVRPVSRRA
ncbi:MAG: MFS transporter [Acidovorax sp.]